MLRVMRSMRYMQIEVVPWRLRYIKLYCAVRIMEPPAAVAIGSRPTRHCAEVMRLIIHDYYHGEVINGRHRMSQRMKMQIEQLEWKLREAAGHVEVE